MAIANGLEIAAYEEQIYFVFLLGLQPLNVAVNCVKLAMTAAFDGNLRRHRSASCRYERGLVGKPSYCCPQSG